MDGQMDDLSIVSLLPRNWPHPYCKFSILHSRSNFAQVAYLHYYCILCARYYRNPQLLQYYHDSIMTSRHRTIIININIIIIKLSTAQKNNNKTTQ